MKIKVLKEGYDFESEEQIEAMVTPSGTGAHITVPKKWIGKNVVVFLKNVVKQWTGGYVKAGIKGMSVDEFSKEIKKELRK
jgi:putative transposon-encoded protein